MDFDQTWSQQPPPQPQHVMWPDRGQRSRRGHRGQKRVFHEKVFNSDTVDRIHTKLGRNVGLVSGHQSITFWLVPIFRFGSRCLFGSIIFLIIKIQYLQS